MSYLALNFSKRSHNTVSTDKLFLSYLGNRVREARTHLALSRKALAKKASVSERFLAQIEAGSGNMSILLLRQIASALHLSLPELIEERDSLRVELALIHRMLKRLPSHKLSALHAQLTHEGGDPDPPAQGRIALLGLRGAGKSTLGNRLARKLGVPFIELDREIEREAGTSLSEVFLLYGQAGYRRYERHCLEKVLERHERAVIATGGSIVSDPGTYELLRSTCYTVWLKADPQEHMARVISQGDTRPMAGNEQAMEDLRRILEDRAPLYAQADLTLDTARKSVNASLAALSKAVASK